MRTPSIVGAVLVLGACCPPLRPAQSAHDAARPSLEGTLWDVAAGRAIERGALLDRLVAARFVLLGETHDNPRHHAWQAELVRGLIAAGRRPAVGFEMIDADRQADVDAARTAHPRDADVLAHAVGWAESGWPAFALYRPIFAAALEADVPVLAANLPHATVRSLAHEGLAALPAERARELGIDRPLAPAVEAQLRQEMSDSHCGMIPLDHTTGLVLAQRARDAQMAAVLAAGAARAGEGGAVGIMGAGHARTDRGVPARLRELLPDATVASVGFIEVDPALGTPGAYAAAFGAARLPFDVVVFTARAEREDPCADMRAALRASESPGARRTRLASRR